MVRVFANGPGDLGSIQSLKKWYLVSPCLTLSIIMYRSRVKWRNPGKGVAPPLHLGVVAIEKVTNFTYIYNCSYQKGHQLYLYIYIYIIVLFRQ